MNTKKKLADLQNAVDVWRANYCAEAAQNVNLRKAVETARMTVPLIAQTAITYFLAAGKGRTAREFWAANNGVRELCRIFADDMGYLIGTERAELESAEAETERWQRDNFDFFKNPLPKIEEPSA